MTAITSVHADRRENGHSARVQRPLGEPSSRPMWRPSQHTMLVAATLFGIFSLGWFSALTRPSEAVAAVWWLAGAGWAIVLLIAAAVIGGMTVLRKR